MHELHHISDGVHGAHGLQDVSLFIVEEFHLMGLVEIECNRVFIAFISLFQIFVYRQFGGDTLDESLNLLVSLVLPRIGASPMVIEILLYHHHLFACRLFGIFLHLGVDGRIDFQSTVVEVISIFFAPVFQIGSNRFSEIVGLSVVVALYAVVERYGVCFQRVVCYL